MFRTITNVDTSFGLILNAFSFLLCFSVRYCHTSLERWTFSYGETGVINRRSIGESSTENVRLQIRTKVLAR